MAVGGDGTFNEVVNGFFEGAQAIATSSTLGLLQIGTGGDTRRTLGIPIEVAAAIRVLVEGRPRLIDTGRATLGTRVYHLVNIAETGIGADVSERVNRMPKYLGSSSGSHVEDVGLRRKMELLHGARVEVSSPATVLVQLDGEVVGQLPATFEVVPQALRFMAPKA